MKKILTHVFLTAFLIFACMAVGFTAAGCAPDKSSAEGSSFDPRWLAEISIEAQDEVPPLHVLTREDEYFREYITDFYGIDLVKVSGGAVFYAGGMLATEFAVFLMSDADAASSVRDALEGYIDNRADAFTGYAPFEAAMAEESFAVSNGVYVAMFICDDPSASEEAFMQCFTDEPPVLRGRVPVAEDAPESTAEATQTPVSEPDPAHDAEATREPSTTTEHEAEQTHAPEVAPSHMPDTSPTHEPEATHEPEPSHESAAEALPDVYDSEAIRHAYNTGDTSRLTPKNLAVLEKCGEVFAEVITDGMSKYEMEVAIHDWICDNVEYDPAEHDNSSNSVPDPDNDNPYGALVNGKAICYGYAYSFQLMTELIGFEAITIEGSSPGGEHAWNMIAVDGEWYCVDVTWDDSGSGRDFFNKSSKYFKDNGHIWQQTDDLPVAERNYRV